MLSECVESFTCHSSVSAIQTSNVHLANGLTFSNYFALLLDIRLWGDPEITFGRLQSSNCMAIAISQMQSHRTTMESMDLRLKHLPTSSLPIPGMSVYLKTPKKETVDPIKNHPLRFHVRIINVRQLCFRN